MSARRRPAGTRYMEAAAGDGGWRPGPGAPLGAAALVCVAFLGACNKPSPLERVHERGYLTIATRNTPTSYYIGPHGKTGFEYDLAKKFADRLGVELMAIPVDSFDAVLPMVAEGKADFAAAGVTITPARRERVRFGPIYQQITQEVVYRGGSSRPRSVEDLTDLRLEIIAGSSYAERLQRLALDRPDLDWTAVSGRGIDYLFQRVVEQAIDCTIADSNILSVHRRFMPRLRRAFSLGEPQSLAWAFPKGPPSDLYRAAMDFFDEIKENGELEELRERYYAHVEGFNFVGTHTYLDHIEARLPELRPYFEQAQRETGVDWRLLAAIGYQESHWNPRAVSPTGVKGVMMLTQATARQMEVSNRLDPKASVLAGARYFKRMRQRLPERIDEPDRTWLALAAYNVGYGHLEDARVITEIRGGDPDRWLDVKENLPLLSQERWYKRTRFGYARGREPVRYVENIRSYYEILRWMVERGDPLLTAGPPAEAA